MAYTVISQNNTTTTLADELGNVIHVPARVQLATSTSYTITKVNNNTATLEDENGKVLRDVPCVVVLYGGSGGGDQHNLGYFATQTALEEAHPTAEAGDWAIVGETDTVWTWDSDTTAWVDTDQKGQVTSVNGQTGAVTIGANDVLPTQTGYSGRVLGTDGFVAGWVKPEIVQRSTMPQAGADELGNIYQFVGTTDANYTNGYFYKCVSDGQEPATYSWEQTSVQPAPSGLPDQTGNSGKFLTTDGTDASWSDKPLVNKAVSASGIIISDAIQTSDGWRSVVIGQESKLSNAGYADCCLIGYKITSAQANNIYIGGTKNETKTISSSGNIIITTGTINISASSAKSNIIIGGDFGTVTSQKAVCVGHQSGNSPLTGQVILGDGGTNVPVNDGEQGSLWFLSNFNNGSGSSSFKIVDHNGIIPAARHASLPAADGTYVLKLVISDGTPTLSWVAE